MKWGLRAPAQVSKYYSVDISDRVMGYVESFTAILGESQSQRSSQTAVRCLYHEDGVVNLLSGAPVYLLSRVYTRATCCPGCRQHVARRANMLPGNMLPWCKRVFSVPLSTSRWSNEYTWIVRIHVKMINSHDDSYPSHYQPLSLTYIATSFTEAKLSHRPMHKIPNVTRTWMKSSHLECYNEVNAMKSWRFHIR